MTVAATWTLRPGTLRVPAAATPDLRGRSYRVHAEVTGPLDGVLFSHGDGQSGEALYVIDDRLTHCYRHAGRSWITRSSAVAAARTLGLTVTRDGDGARVALLADDVVVGEGRIDDLARARLALDGMDVGCDRGQPVGPYAAPAAFAGTLHRLVFTAGDDQDLDVATERLIEAATG
jgi:hypothetical protein